MGGAGSFQEGVLAFQLEDELIVKEGRDVTVGLTYRRRKKASADKVTPSSASD
jgi:hypothetical protein